ncbi:hypothetical protein Psch_03459 [Pelotomaculum schinkii]|uniref:CobQ/CobB/MinD/ParA nucleotide binding domain protein n=1 Tax=Pelotomaculum schinkii TaxID=78350 RepID=A0A4Y7R778_9FIRM|nr:hypothetical protein [Pelotomaculum schinkii]TEB04697.1 hypothetical protein Psch_03459 [Pelotomaculum schinkii]
MGIIEILNKAGRACLFFGIKGGVGTSAVIATVTGILVEHGAVHFELSLEPDAWCYYGKSTGEAEGSGKYYSLKSRVPGEVPVLLIDVGTDAPLEEVSLAFSFSDCVVMVIDRSEISFNLARKYLEAGVVPDVLVVCRTFPGLGNGAEVCQGEFGRYGIGTIIGVPGSVDEERAVISAQRRGVSPCGQSVELDAAAGEIAAAILQKMEVRSC